MKVVKTLITAVTLMFFAVPFAAADPGFYIGAKIGTLEPENDDFDADDDNPVALQIGYDFGGLAIQAEAYSSESEVENSGVDAELDVMSLYAVLRSSGFFYFMGKAGIVDGEIELTGFDTDDTSASYGVGAGLNFGDTILVEAEYLVFDVDDTDFDFFGVSANLKF